MDKLPTIRIMFSPSEEQQEPRSVYVTRLPQSHLKIHTTCSTGDTRNKENSDHARRAESIRKRFKEQRRKTTIRGKVSRNNVCSSPKN